MAASTRQFRFALGARWRWNALVALGAICSGFIAPFVHAAAHSASAVYATSDEYDPFEESDAAAGEPTQCDYQQGNSTSSEPLPIPGGAPEPPLAGSNPAKVQSDDTHWQPEPLRDLSTTILLPGGLLPRDYWSERSPDPLPCGDGCTTRCWSTNCYNWRASCLAHNPLYFEDVNLERYGYGCGCGECCGCNGCCATCLQSGCAAAHFFGAVPALPYLMAADCPGDCNYTLGHYRPGSCPPWRNHCCSDCSALGGLSEAGVLTGLIFLIP